MNHRWLVHWALLLVLIVLAGCSLEAAPVAETPPTPTTLPPAPSVAPTVAPTTTPTTEPSPTPEPIAEETATAEAIETRTAEALVDTSYCRREFGPVNAPRFGARLDGVRTDQTSDYDQTIFSFSDLQGELHGTASCRYANAWPQDTTIGATQAPGAAFIAIELDDWAHDDRFAASPLTETLTISTTDGAAQRVAFAADALDSRGALLGIELPAPQPFRVRVQNNELIVEVAREAAFPPENDPLGRAEGDAPELTDPFFFLHRGDVYRFENGQAQPVIETPEQEIGLALSPDGTMLALCRAPADAEPFAIPYDVRATLWTMRADGSDQQQLADVGGCAEPAFAASGRTIAFTANVAPSPPAVLHVWTVPVVGGDATPVTAAFDEWSRSAPRWLADGRLIYRASNNDQSVIFVRDEDGTERELTAQLLTGQDYQGVGAFVVDPNSGEIALEALRAADDGADLVVLRDDGTTVATEQRGFWQRPLAYSSDGLIYLSADCPSETVLNYTVQRRSAQGAIEALASGTTAAAIGAATTADDALIYVRSDSQPASVHGPAATPAPDAASSIWLVSGDGMTRAELFAADSSITALESGGQP